MSSRPIICAAALLLSVAVTTLLACEIRVRDSAFRMARDVHRLCVIADSTDEVADEIQQRLDKWLAETDGELNLRIERINADDPETDWRALGIPSAPPSMPVTVLLGRDNGIGESFLVDYWEPSPSPDELAALVDSPVRHQLAQELATHVAVMVFAPRDPSNQQSSATRRIEAIVEAGIADERIGISMITIDRYDPAERLLCRFMGLRPDSPDTLCVAFGRGKLMSPPLTGEDISAESVETLVTTIRQACSCSKPLATIGVDMPLVWTNAVDSTVILMDDELDLDQLDAEIEEMLAGKAEKNETGEPTVIPIPAGSPPPSPASESATAVADTDVDAQPANSKNSEANNSAATITTGLGLLIVVAAAIVLLRRRATDGSTPTDHE